MKIYLVYDGYCNDLLGVFLDIEKAHEWLVNREGINLLSKGDDKRLYEDGFFIYAVTPLDSEKGE